MRKVYVVGLGPGGSQYLTAEAQAALAAADVLCGYTVYVELVAPLYPEKETYTTPMTKKLDRCRWALETARSGWTVALVCSGDAGVYGMASPVLELAPDYPEVDVEVVAGVTAALSGGAVLGAPLGHDFCVISLSDLLTPWEVIEKRLACAAAELLAETEGNILLTTGAKELGAFAGLDPSRLFARVLPTHESLAACEAAGIPYRNILAMQGPFSQELNEAVIRQFCIAVLVTKDGGKAGGFPEKALAARRTGVRLILIRRPDETGETFGEIVKSCEELMKCL